MHKYLDRPENAGSNMVYNYWLKQVIVATCEKAAGGEDKPLRKAITKPVNKPLPKLPGKEGKEDKEG